ncbi:hypothetical protein [Listeria monocytogenes]|uniref:hypothetical protein n=1 Tax=Listeria monocytogenes TaxID=1639 RepID=UPI0009A49755|nr:hypothetical protein [Listeria monocytogenes]
MNEEWFEFVGYSESQTKYVNIDDQLNELSKTHEIIEVHFSTYSSSDWNYLSIWRNCYRTCESKKERGGGINGSEY